MTQLEQTHQPPVETTTEAIKSTKKETAKNSTAGVLALLGLVGLGASMLLPKEPLAKQFKDLEQKYYETDDPDEEERLEKEMESIYARMTPEEQAEVEANFNKQNIVVVFKPGDMKQILDELMSPPNIAATATTGNMKTISQIVDEEVKRMFEQISRSTVTSTTENQSIKRDPIPLYPMGKGTPTHLDSFVEAYKDFIRYMDPAGHTKRDTETTQNLWNQLSTEDKVTASNIASQLYVAKYLEIVQNWVGSDKAKTDAMSNMWARMTPDEKIIIKAKVLNKEFQLQTEMNSYINFKKSMSHKLNINHPEYNQAKKELNLAWDKLSAEAKTGVLRLPNVWVSSNQNN